MKKLLWLLFFCIAFTRSQAQNLIDFSTDPTKFLEQITDYINVTKRDDCKAVADQLKTVWPSISPDQQSAIIDLANLMHNKKELTYPYFYKFVRAVVDFKNGKDVDAIFDSWQTLANQLLNALKTATNKPYESFLDFSHNLFADNCLFESGTRKWLSSSPAYGFIYLNNKPAVRIDDLDFIGMTDGDTITIQKTSGTYYFMDNLWVGDKGKTNWTRAGIEEDKAYINFGKYKIDCVQAEFSVDSAHLFYLPFANGNLLGKYTDKLVQHNKKETSSYPKFDSYDKHIKVDNLSNTITYLGGLSFQGSRVYGAGSPDQKAEMVFERYDGKVGMVARSNFFDIKKMETIISNETQVTIYIGKDSLYHAGCVLKFQISNNKAYLYRGDHGIAKSAFYDTYQNHEIKADELVWDMNQPVIEFRNQPGAGTDEATFESVDYFEPLRLHKFQSITDYNIISVMKLYCDHHDSTRFIYGADLAKTINPTYQLETIKNVLYKLCEDGFIYYDESKDLITVRDKVFKYTMADVKRVDYDNIKIISNSDSVYATLDLTSMDLNLNGVRNVSINDSTSVVFFPENDSLKILKDRDMQMSGMMFAGRWDLHGRGFVFHYEDFNTGLTSLDSIVINIPRNNDVDKSGNTLLVPLHSTIENASGMLQMDLKNNKSGKSKVLKYPSIHIDKPSFIYYDRRGKYGPLYVRDKYYYQVNPFVVDSLNSFSVARMRFSGKLVSAGIFPDIAERLRVQDDLSLGFNTTRKDLPMYGGLGTYSDTINLDNSGLRGKGSFKFLTSESKSNDIIFFPELMEANIQSFAMKRQTYKGVDFPSISGENDFTRWSPYKDSMWVNMKDRKFELFDNFATLKGNVLLRSSGASSAGTVDWPDAQLTSKNIQFGGFKMNADTSDFSIKSIDSTKFALTTHNVNAKIDFEKREGDFSSNTDDITTEFPYNLYRTSISTFHWDMDKKLLSFTASTNRESYFTSMHPQQDSLRFIGTSATYDLKTFLLKVDGVEKIPVVDALIYPDTERVYIEPNAVMRHLYNAKIEADTINNYHKFYNCSVNVFGKQLYNAKGDYDFEGNDLPVQKLHFDEIGVYKDDHKNLRTYAKTKVDTAEHFRVLNKVMYKGKINLLAPDANLKFDGYAKLDLNNPHIRAEWFTVNDEFNKDSTYLYYNDPDNEYHKPVTVGIVYATDSSDLYTSFFNAKKSTGDKNIFTANGIVYYDTKEKSWIAGDKDKILNGTSRGNMLTYNDETGQVNAQGKMDLGLNFGFADEQAAGSINTDLTKNEYNLTLCMGLNFPMDKTLMEMMAKDISDNTTDVDNIDYNSDDFQQAIVEFVPPKQEKKALDRISKDGMLKKNSDFPYTFFFTDMHLKWDKSLKIFYSTGKLGISFIGEKNLNIIVPAYIEFGLKHGTGDYMNLYIKMGDEDYYFFNYQNNILQILSSNKDFMTAMNAIDPEKRRYQNDDKTKSYQYTNASDNKVKTFVNKMKFLEDQDKKKK